VTPISVAGLVGRSGTSVTLLRAGEASSTRSTFGIGLVVQQDLLLVGRLKNRCPPFKASPCHRRGTWRRPQSGTPAVPEFTT